MVNEISFDIASLDDASSIEMLVNAAYRGDTSRRGWTTEAELLDGQRTDKQAIHDIISLADNIIILCLSNTTTIGTLHLRREENICHLGMFTVYPDLQGQGIGKQFISYAEHYACKEWACHSMTMTVIDIRHELLQWYERRGYFDTEETTAFPYGDERFGIPRRDDLKLTILKKSLS